MSFEVLQYQPADMADDEKASITSHAILQKNAENTMEGAYKQRGNCKANGNEKDSYIYNQKGTVEEFRTHM